jgi:formylmethanofuran dehydrogenase subunit E
MVRATLTEEKHHLVAAAEVQPFLAETAAMHRHLCPRQVLGVRMGLYAGKLLHLELPQREKRLYTFVETDGCFIDGVTVATGCSVGHRTLRLIDHGKVAASFVDTKTGKAVRIWPNPQCRTRATEYAPTAPNRWQAQLEAYQIMSAEELLSSCNAELLIDLKALIARPGVRVNCNSCGEEILNQREVILDGKALCRGCTGGSYVRCLAASAKR